VAFATVVLGADVIEVASDAVGVSSWGSIASTRERFWALVADPALGRFKFDAML
jgi:hypothetical protein